MCVCVCQEWDTLAKDIEAAEVKVEAHLHRSSRDPGPGPGEMCSGAVKLPALQPAGDSSPDGGGAGQGAQGEKQPRPGGGGGNRGHRSLSRSLSRSSVAKGADAGAFNMKPEGYTTSYFIFI